MDMTPEQRQVARDQIVESLLAEAGACYFLVGDIMREGGITLVEYEALPDDEKAYLLRKAADLMASRSELGGAVDLAKARLRSQKRKAREATR